MSDKHTSTHKKGQKGFSDEMANQINRQQATKVQHKIASRKIHASKPKQGYTPHRSGVDTSTL